MAMANPSPIAGPTDVRPARATASAARGETRSSAPPSRKVDTVMAIQSTMRPTAPRSPSAKRSRARSTSPADRRALGDHGRVARHHVTAHGSGLGDDDAAVQRGDVVVDPAVDDHVAVEREHPVVHDGIVAHAHVAVEDQHPIDRLATADVDVAGDDDLIVAFGGDGHCERRRRARAPRARQRTRTQPFW